MLKQTVTYEDFNGHKITEDLYFNLSKSEMIDLETAEEGSLSDRFKAAQRTNDARAVYRQFKDIILLAYGQKSDDGRKFLKSEQIRHDFEQSAAYDEFIWGLFQDVDRLNAFIAGVIPKKALEDALAAHDARKIDLGPEQNQAVDTLRKLQARQTEAKTSAEPEKGTFGQGVEEPKKPGLTEEEVAEFLRSNPDFKR